MKAQLNLRPKRKVGILTLSHQPNAVLAPVLVDRHLPKLFPSSEPTE